MNHVPIAHVEDRLMPGTFDTCAVKCSLIEGAAGVRTYRTNSIYGLNIAIHQHWRAVDLNSPCLILADLAQRQHCRPISWHGRRWRVVHADAPPIDHVATQPG